MQYYNNNIEEKHPKLIEYFKKGISSDTRSIGHLLLFWGPDITSQYEIALEIARLFNCQKDKSINCDCVNCNGIRNNTHEAVKLYTRLDNKDTRTNSEDGKGKTNITIEQARNISNEISLTSIYHRVYIFCDRDNDGNLLPLNRINFPDATANSLLKTFEEPTNNTTFIILTSNCSDVISTVVSRSQTFFVPFCKEDNKNFELVKDIISNYWTLKREDVFDFADNLFQLTQEQDELEVFSQLQNYILDIIYSNINNKQLFYKLSKDLKLIEASLNQLKLSPEMSRRTIVDNFSYNLILG